MLASALSQRHELSNRQGRPYSFAQMFDQSGLLDPNVADAVDSVAKDLLEQLMAQAKNLIDENNGAKHAGMGDVFLYPADYPDFLKDLSAQLLPEVTTGKNIREWLDSLRTRTADLGEAICRLLPILFN